MISQLLPIYWRSILAGTVAAINLAQLGIHLATRDRAMQTLCLSQGATVGVLLGIGLIPLFTPSELALHFGPIVFAIAAALGTATLGDRIANRHATSRNTYFISIFASLLGAGYLITALFPSLENHLTQIYFGDLATMSDRESLFVLAISTVSALWVAARWRMFTNTSFELAAFGEAAPGPADRYFPWLSLVSLCVSVQYLGLLFTISALFLPTVLLRDDRAPNLMAHLISVPVVAGIATVAGFLFSLGVSRLPTVPTITLLMILVGLAGRGAFAAARDVR